jgi:hypothetical protein
MDDSDVHLLPVRLQRLCIIQDKLVYPVPQFSCQRPLSAFAFYYLIVHCRILFVIPDSTLRHGAPLHVFRAKSKRFIHNVPLCHGAFRVCALPKIAFHCFHVTLHGVHWMWLIREPGAGSGEGGAGKKRAGSRDCRKKSRNR